MIQITIGIDISKDNLDVATYPQKSMRQFTNNDKGIGALLAWMTDLEGVEQIIFGAYRNLCV